VDVFLHNFANAIWSLKRPKGPPLSISVTFFQQKISTTLQRLQTSSILSWVIVVGLTTSWLPPLQNTSPISTIDLLQVAGSLYGKIWSTYYKWSFFDMYTFWHLVWANLTSCKFSFFFFLIPLHIFLIYGVSINKVLQGCTKISPNELCCVHFWACHFTHYMILCRIVLCDFHVSCFVTLFALFSTCSSVPSWIWI
jgi:hypothetical protein